MGPLPDPGCCKVHTVTPVRWTPVALNFSWIGRSASPPNSDHHQAIRCGESSSAVHVSDHQVCPVWFLPEVLVLPDRRISAPNFVRYPGIDKLPTPHEFRSTTQVRSKAATGREKGKDCIRTGHRIQAIRAESPSILLPPLPARMVLTMTATTRKKGSRGIFQH